MSELVYVCVCLCVCVCVCVCARVCVRACVCLSRLQRLAGRMLRLSRDQIAHIARKWQ